jgi:DNA (cytosine-5)-methyltransferase 1
MNYYNEFDPKAAAWLRELIAAGQIPRGEVDDRSIVEVRPGDLAGYVQCHFFAGIGGWAYALKLAGWPESRSVWTASLPCQPFSPAGQRRNRPSQNDQSPTHRPRAEGW